MEQGPSYVNPEDVDKINQLLEEKIQILTERLEEITAHIATNQEMLDQGKNLLAIAEERFRITVQRNEDAVYLLGKGYDFDDQSLQRIQDMRTSEEDMNASRMRIEDLKKDLNEFEEDLNKGNVIQAQILASLRSFEEFKQNPKQTTADLIQSIELN